MPPPPTAVIEVDVCPKQIVGLIGTMVTLSVGLIVTLTVSHTVAKFQVEAGSPHIT